MTSRLASLLVQEGLVGAKQMADAFQRQVIYGGTLDTILLEMNALGEPPLLAALGRASALPTGEALPNLERLRAAGVLHWFPMGLAEKFRAVPIGVDGKVVRVLTIDPPDRRGLDLLGREIGRAIEAQIGPEHRYIHALSLLYDAPIPARFQSLQARLARRAAQSGTPAPVVAAMPAPVEVASPVATPAPVEVPAPSLPVVSQPTDNRSVLTDVPVPGAPVHAHDLMETPRLTTREVGAPAPVEREVGGPVPTAPAKATSTDQPADKLDLAEAVAAIDAAGDRDEIFAALCRGARARTEFVVLFTVHGDSMAGRVALADAWIDRDALASISMSLEVPSPFRTAVQGRSPIVGKAGEDEATRALLASLGRRAPLPAVIVPVVLRERTVALLYADAGGRGLAVETTGDLSNLTGAAARAFQRLILAAKGRDYRAGPGTTTGKVKPAMIAATTVDAAGGWHSGGGHGTGRLTLDTLQAPATEQPSWQPSAPSASSAPSTPSAREDKTVRLQPAGGRGDDVSSLFTSVERGDENAQTSADRLLALGAQGAELTVARLPGPLRIDRERYRGVTPPLSDHGPLLALLARFGDAALPYLLRRASDGRADIRAYVTLALGELGRERCVTQIHAALFDREASVRRVAVDALVKLPGSAEKKSVVESLRGELPGPERARQHAAAAALGALGDGQSVPRLIELVKHEDDDVRLSAQQALVAITKQDFGNSRWRWRGWWDRHKTEPRTEWLFEGLAHASDEIRAAAAAELRRMLPESFGYNWDAPKRDREDARRRWLEWYRARGRG